MLPLIARAGAQILAKSAQAGARTGQVANVGGQAAGRAAQVGEAGSTAGNASKAAGQTAQNAQALKDRLTSDQITSALRQQNATHFKALEEAWQKIRWEQISQASPKSDLARRNAEAIKGYL